MNLNLLEVYHFPHKIRLGSKHDGGYVICKLENNYDCYISCGVSYDANFDRDILNVYKNLNKDNSFAFDGTIDDYPWFFTEKINFIKKNISNIEDDNHSNLGKLIKKYNNIFLSMDIEGAEYAWILSLSKEQIKKFKQICIEFHGINDDSWGASLKNKLKCLSRLKETHYLMHVHGNNYGNKTNGIPDIVELTYINKNSISYKPEMNKKKMPIEGLDYPNNKFKNDFILDKYPFVQI